jgi:hypothetical protein
MTAAQETAFKQIMEIMREHFAAGVIIIEGELADNDHASDIETAFHGGYATSIGLLEIAKIKVWQTGKDDSHE